jgi:hypothetical protein
MKICNTFKISLLNIGMSVAFHNILGGQLRLGIVSHKCKNYYLK